MFQEQINYLATIIAKIIIILATILLLNIIFKKGYIQKLIDWLASLLAWSSNHIIDKSEWLINKAKMTEIEEEEINE